MIDRIDLLRNIGQFDSDAPPPCVKFTPFTLIYAENARGKTTLAAILRSLKTGNTNLVNERHRLGAKAPPHIVISHSSGNSVFENDDWSNIIPEIVIFDESFIEENICSGRNLDRSHRKNLHELIIGAEGVRLNVALHESIEKIEKHITALRTKSKSIANSIREPFSLDEFCDLERDSDIDAKIQQVEQRFKAAASAEMVQKKCGFELIELPTFNVQELDEVFPTS